MTQTFPSDTSTAFVVGLKSGTNEAWQRFLQIYEPIVRSMCRDSLDDSNDVDEIVSAVVTKAFKYLQSFERRQQGRLRNYVRKVTWSQIQDHYRRKKREAAKTISQPVFDRKYSDHFLRRIIHQVRNERRFSDSSWRAFEMYVSDVRCYQTIGERLQLKPETASRAIRRILAAIDDELKLHGE